MYGHNFFTQEDISTAGANYIANRSHIRYTYYLCKIAEYLRDRFRADNRENDFHIPEDKKVLEAIFSDKKDSIYFDENCTSNIVDIIIETDSQFKDELILFKYDSVSNKYIEDPAKEFHIYYVYSANMLQIEANLDVYEKSQNLYLQTIANEASAKIPNTCRFSKEKRGYQIRSEIDKALREIFKDKTISVFKYKDKTRCLNIEIDDDIIYAMVIDIITVVYSSITSQAQVTLTTARKKCEKKDKNSNVESGSDTYDEDSLADKKKLEKKDKKGINFYLNKKVANPPIKRINDFMSLILANCGKDLSYEYKKDFDKTTKRLRGLSKNYINFSQRGIYDIFKNIFSSNPKEYYVAGKFESPFLCSLINGDIKLLESDASKDYAIDR